MGGVPSVVVVGGGGFLGSRAVEALEKVPGLTVGVASRSSALRVDLSDPSTFESLRGARVVVDLADATTTRPDALAAWCLENGVTFLETTSDMPAVDRLAKIAPGTSPTGAIVLGAGIFTGLSNLLASAAAKKAGPAPSLELAIRSSPFSGAGKGTVALMASMLSVAAVSYAEGRRVEHPPVGAGPRVEFPSASVPSLRVPLAEEVMLAASTGAPNVDVYFAPKPSILVYAFRMLPLFLLRSGFFAAFMRAYFSFVRRFILANRVSTTEIVADAKSGTSHARLSLSAADGMRAGGVAIAAIAAEIAARPEAPRGVLMVDQLVELEAVLARIETIAGAGCVTLRS